MLDHKIRLANNALSITNVLAWLKDRPVPFLIAKYLVLLRTDDLDRADNSAYLERDEIFSGLHNRDVESMSDRS